MNSMTARSAFLILAFSGYPTLRAGWLREWRHDKYLSLVGLDVAIEALRAAWGSRAVTMDELWQATAQTRMTIVMRPYLESLSGAPRICPRPSVLDSGISRSVIASISVPS